MQTVKVVGAGFSGLVTAYYLVNEGFKVRICESSSRAGGLIQTIKTEYGLVETAANGIRNSARLEAMCVDIGVPLWPTRGKGRARFIFRGRPKQFPLTSSDILKLGYRFATSATSLRPARFETIADWGRRVVGAGATEYFLAPALGGIYAADPNVLSASLVFGRAALPEHLQADRPARPRLRGTVAPPQGMQQLVDGLCNYLERAGAEFIFNYEGPAESDDPTVICTSACAASEHLAGVAPELSDCLGQIEMTPLVTATCQYQASTERLRGFGCLFPRSEGFRALGVLFNTCIFDGRGPAHSETWMFGGALDREVVKLSDAGFAQLIAAERERLYGQNDEVLGIHLTRWPEALPNYSIELERILTTLPPPPPTIALVGNYLGRIGLGKIVERAACVAKAFRKVL